MTPIEKAERTLRRSSAFMGLGLLLLAVVYVRALLVPPADLAHWDLLERVFYTLLSTPLEKTQGAAQKIFYLHVPSAWVAFLAFGLVGVCSALYLFLRDPRLDRFAASAAEVGVVFTTVVLVTGPIWAKPIWGTWWTWDARLTSTLFLWFIYFGYLVLRRAVEEPARRARYSAVLGILGSLLVPFIHVSVLLFRTLHPKPVVLNPGGPTLPGAMLATLLFSLGVFTIFFFSLVAHRYAQATVADARTEADDAR